MAKQEAIFYEGHVGEGSTELELFLGKLEEKGYRVKRQTCPKDFESWGRCPMLQLPGGITLFGMANIRDYIELVI